MDLACYTFGGPRTGNHAFAAEYNDNVPDTWCVSVLSPGLECRQHAPGALQFLTFLPLNTLVAVHL